MGSQNSGFALIFERLTMLPNLILIRYQDSKKLHLFCTSVFFSLRLLQRVLASTN